MGCGIAGCGGCVRYVLRSRHNQPKNGPVAPWASQSNIQVLGIRVVDYIADTYELEWKPLEEKELQFVRAADVKSRRREAAIAQQAAAAAARAQKGVPLRARL